jgi:hypothetical protein
MPIDRASETYAKSEFLFKIRAAHPKLRSTKGTRYKASKRAVKLAASGNEEATATMVGLLSN